MSCEICRDRGVYRDPQCVEGSCAHRQGRYEQRTVSTRRVPGTKIYQVREILSRHGPPIMACPDRTCLCLAGRARRRQQRRQAVKV